MSNQRGPYQKPTVARFNFNPYFDYDIDTGKIIIPTKLKIAIDNLEKKLSTMNVE